MRNLKKLAFALVPAFVFSMAGPAEAKLASVDFNRYYMDSDETAWLKGYDEQGNQMWYYQCDLYPAAQLNRISWLGFNDGLVCFVEAGDIVALDEETGYEVWRNKDFGGSPAPDAFTFSSSGKLYISGYLGPDLFIVDHDGKTLGRHASLTSGSYWPYDLEFKEGDILRIRYESDESYIDIDVKDYFTAK